METIAHRFSIGPGAIAASPLWGSGAGPGSTESNGDGSEGVEPSPFIMSTADWIDIQRYVEKGLRLPTSVGDIWYSVFSNPVVFPPKSVANLFDEISAVYKGINTHGSDWKNHTFPLSVSLATDVFEYSCTVRKNYLAIINWTTILQAKPTNNEARNQLSLLLTTLSRTARIYQQRCRDVAGHIQRFAIQSEQDQRDLNGADGKGGVQARCRQVRKEVWETLQRMQTGKGTQQVSDLYVQRQLLRILDDIQTDIGDISNALSNSLNIILTMEGSWKAISDDFDSLVRLIAHNITQALPCIRDLGVEAAISTWENVGRAADKYRRNAFIKISESA